MKKKLYLNEICSTLDNERDYYLYLNRLYSIKPTFKIKPPKKPKFLILNTSQLLKRAQTEYNIEYENLILKNRIEYITSKKGPYNQNYLRPKTGLPAFKKKIFNYSYQDKENIKKILKNNKYFYNKISKIKSYYENDKMKEEAKKQVKYMNNILAKNRTIKRPPNLNYQDFETFKKYIKSQNENDNIQQKDDKNIIEEKEEEEEEKNEKKEDEEKNEKKEKLN